MPTTIAVAPDQRSNEREDAIITAAQCSDGAARRGLGYVREAVGISAWSASLSLAKFFEPMTTRLDASEYENSTLTSASAIGRKIFATVPGRSCASAMTTSRSSRTLK